MRRILAVCVALAAAHAAVAQPAVTQPSAAQPAAAQAPAQAPAQAGGFAEAMALYQRGRELDAAGRAQDAAAKYSASLSMADRAIAKAAPGPGAGILDLYAVKCWSLFRLGRYEESVSAGLESMKTGNDLRIVETMGEASFHLGRNEDALKYLARYADMAPPTDERLSSAYFYMGETYLRMRQYGHADIAYSAALHLAPHMARWWYRHGVALEALGQYRRAWDAFGSALERNPKMADAAEARARVKAKAGL